MTREFTLLSLFSGAGGLDFGFKLTGKFKVILGNDVFQPAVETFSRNFQVKILTLEPKLCDLPAVFYGDVAKLTFDGLEDLQPDVITGGPPCQDFSIVRGPPTERGGISVSRGKLYSHFVRALIRLQPYVFVFENVPGIISVNGGEAYKVIVDDFSNLEIRWPEIKKLVTNNSARAPKNYELLFSEVVDASKLGVPQARKRLIIIGIRKDLVQSIWWKIELFKRKVKSILNGSVLLHKYPLTPLEAFEGKPLPELQEKYEEVMRQYKGVAGEVGTPIALGWERNKWKKLNFDIVKDYLAINNIETESKDEITSAFEEHAKLLREMGYYSVNVRRIKPADGSNEIPVESKDVLERMKRIPPGENHEFVRGTRWEVEGRGMSLIYRRIHPLKPAYTVVAYGGGGTWGYHYERDRATLTNRESARLQTFPDSFLFAGTRAQIRAQIGEAVPPLLAKRISEAIAEVLEELV